MFKKIKEFIKAFKNAYNTINVYKINAKKAIDDYSKMMDVDFLNSIGEAKMLVIPVAFKDMSLNEEKTKIIVGKLSPLGFLFELTIYFNTNE